MHDDVSTEEWYVEVKKVTRAIGGYIQRQEYFLCVL